MTDTALDRARRGAHAAHAACCDSTREPRNLADLTADGCDLTTDAIARLEAAARLAGRLEQAEISYKLTGYGDKKAWISDKFKEERDRLRAELAAAGKGGDACVLPVGSHLDGR